MAYDYILDDIFIRLHMANTEFMSSVIYTCIESNELVSVCWTTRYFKKLFDNVIETTRLDCVSSIYAMHPSPDTHTKKKHVTGGQMSDATMYGNQAYSAASRISQNAGKLLPNLVRPFVVHTAHEMSDTKPNAQFANFAPYADFNLAAAVALHLVAHKASTMRY